jgi:hypothetical protein
MMHPSLLLGVSALDSPVERMLRVTRWYLSGWHYKTVGVKKPFNPIVGETFAAAWGHDDGSRTQYFAEQVAHRPPISAIYFENSVHHVQCSAHVWTKGQFQAPQTTKSILDGACVLSISNLGEEYWITFPTFYAHNLLLGKLRMEVGDAARIVCSKTGLSATLNFNQIGMFTSADVLHSVSGTITRFNQATRKNGDVLYKIRGNWDKQLYATAEGGEEKVRAP